MKRPTGTAAAAAPQTPPATAAVRAQVATWLARLLVADVLDAQRSEGVKDERSQA